MTTQGPQQELTPLYRLIDCQMAASTIRLQHRISDEVAGEIAVTLNRWRNTYEDARRTATATIAAQAQEIVQLKANLVHQAEYANRLYEELAELNETRNSASWAWGVIDEVVERLREENKEDEDD